MAVPLGSLAVDDQATAGIAETVRHERQGAAAAETARLQAVEQLGKGVLHLDPRRLRLAAALVDALAGGVDIVGVAVLDIPRRVDLVADQPRRENEQPLALGGAMAGGGEQHLADHRDIAEPGNPADLVVGLQAVKPADHQRATLGNDRLGADIALAYAGLGDIEHRLVDLPVLDIEDQLHLRLAIAVQRARDHLQAGAGGDRLDIGDPLTGGGDVLGAAEVDDRRLVFQGQDRRVAHHGRGAPGLQRMHRQGEPPGVFRRQGRP